MEVSKITEHNATRDEKEGDNKDVSTAQEIEDEAGQGVVLYSKRSIFFMVLFSGLAIGSDAYNSALMGQLLLLFSVLYPDSLTVAKQSQLTNA